MSLKNAVKDFQLSADKSVHSVGGRHHIEMPPEEDTLSLRVFKTGSRETLANLRVTLRRLRWRFSGKEGWADQILRIGKEELVTGEDRFLEVNTNDSRTKYDVLATLEANGVTLQEEKFSRKGSIYTIWLNKFYETIYKNRGQVDLRTEIREKTGQVTGKLDLIHFCEAVGEQQEDASKRAPEKALKVLGKKLSTKCAVKAKPIRPKVRCARGMRAGKGFSHDEVKEAGIGADDLHRLNIRLDKRRKSAYSHNIESLKSSTGVNKDGD